MTSIDTSTSNVNMINSITVGPAADSGFPQVKLRMRDTSEAGEAARTSLDQLINANDKTKECYEIFSQARKVQAYGGYTSDADGPGTKFHTECAAIQQYCQDNGLPYTSANNTDNWDSIITSLGNHLEQMFTDLQQETAVLQDNIGQYASYLSGAKSAV